MELYITEFYCWYVNQVLRHLVIKPDPSRPTKKTTGDDSGKYIDVNRSSDIGVGVQTVYRLIVVPVSSIDLEPRVVGRPRDPE